jgi:hypothetical protein
LLIKILQKLEIIVMIHGKNTMEKYTAVVFKVQEQSMYVAIKYLCGQVIQDTVDSCRKV